MQGSLSPQIKQSFPGLPTTTRDPIGVKVSSIGVKVSPIGVRVSSLGVWSAALFAFSSFSLVAVNKLILTSYGFPSPLSLALGQMLASVLAIRLGRFLGVLSLPPLSLRTLVSVQPLPPLYLLNAISGLSSTQMLPLPMFTVLRRFSILFTLVGEYLLLSQTVSRGVLLSVLLMVLGAIVAASGDLTFQLYPYVVITLNNVSTASLNVVTKLKTSRERLGEYGLVYFNTLLMIPFLSLLMYYNGDFSLAYNYTKWHNPNFIILFLCSCLTGFLLNYSTMLCTRANSALTTSVIGTMKNVFITYIGMVIGGDYIYSLLNFIGVSVSVLSGILYSVFKLANW